MLNLVSIDGLGNVGLNTDLPAWDLPPSAITDGVNFRTQNGAITTNGGSSLWFNSESLTDIGFAISLGDRFDDVIVLCALSGIYAFDGETLTQLLDLSLTPVADIRGWSGCLSGSIVYVNHPELGAYYWVPQLAPVNPVNYLPFNATQDWDSNTLGRYGRVIRAHRNILFMLNMNETISSVDTPIPDSYRWSHPSDINSVPPSWDDTDPLFLAGFAELGDDTGRIVDGLSLRDSFVIYSEKGINVLELTDDVFVWTRRQYSTTAGLLSRDCVIEVNGYHYYLTNGDVYIFDGSNSKSVMQDKIRKHLQANLSHDTYKNSFAVSNLNYKEIWFCVPRTGSTYPNIAYIYNWDTSCWSIRNLPENISFGLYGSKSSGAILWQTLEDMSPQPIWQDYAASWGTATFSPFDDTVIVTTINGELLDVDISGSIGASIGDASSYPNTMVQRSNLVLNGSLKTTTINAIFPKIIGGAPVRIYIGSQDYPNSPITWKNHVVYNPNTDRKVNVRSTGNFHAWKVESIDGGQFTISGMDIEYASAGQR